MTDYRAFALDGIVPQGLTIIDAHNHIGPYPNFRVSSGGSIETLTARAKKVGINRLFLTAHAAIGPDMCLGNDIVRDAIDRFPNAAWGYVTIKPCTETQMLYELDRCLEHPGFRGIKLHPELHGRAVDDPIYEPVYACANQCRLPLLIHTWGHANLDSIDRLAPRYPNAQFIAAHLGGAPDALERALQVIVSHDNVYGDTAISAAPYNNIMRTVQKIGSEKLLFGTDMPFYDPAFTLARVLCAGLSDGQLENILGINILRICAMRTK